MKYSCAWVQGQTQRLRLLSVSSPSPPHTSAILSIPQLVGAEVCGARWVSSPIRRRRDSVSETSDLSVSETSPMLMYAEVWVWVCAGQGCAWHLNDLAADVCSRMLTYAHVCSHMLTYADVVLTYADGRLALIRSRLQQHGC